MSSIDSNWGDEEWRHDRLHAEFDDEPDPSDYEPNPGRRRRTYPRDWHAIWTRGAA
jgi:hypothetical protein